MERVELLEELRLRERSLCGGELYAYSERREDEEPAEDVALGEGDRPLLACYERCVSH